MGKRAQFPMPMPSSVTNETGYHKSGNSLSQLVMVLRLCWLDLEASRRLRIDLCERATTSGKPFKDPLLEERLFHVRLRQDTATIAVTRTAGGTLGPVDESIYSTPADNDSKFRIADCHYIYNLAARKLGAGTYRVDISINGFVVGQAVFALEKEHQRSKCRPFDDKHTHAAASDDDDRHCEDRDDEPGDQDQFHDHDSRSD